MGKGLSTTVMPATNGNCRGVTSLKRAGVHNSNSFVSARTEPEGVRWKSEKNINQFEVLRDDGDVIK